MSRTGLHRPRHTRAVWDRPANNTRLFPYPLPPTFPVHIPHYKRCPKAHRLRLRSDQSLSLPVYVTGYGRSPDKKRLTLSKGPCQVRAPLTRRISFASSGDAPEHGVIVLPWATAPFSDSAVAAIAGQSEQSDERRLKTNAPFRDSTVVTIGDLRSTNAGHGSTLPSLGVVEHFWWSRPHRESFSRLFHIPSEVRGCRKAGFDVEHPLWRTTPIGTGVAVFLRNRPGPSIPSPSVPSPVGATGWSPWGGASSPTTHERNRLLAHTPIISHAHPFPSSGALTPRIARNSFPRNNQAGTNF